MDTPMARRTPDKYMTALVREIGLGDAALHDLRRTVATGLGAIGVQTPLIERVQGRDTRSQMAATYNRHDYMDEKRRALELWEGRLQAIVNGKPLPTERW